MESGAGRRIRIRFDDPTLLSPSQVSHGLRRCWLLFQPSQILTIAELISHLLDKFSLRPSCPDGLLLFMTGYVLPPFESTSILVDNDIVRVKKIKSSGVKAIEPYKAEDHSSGSHMVEEKQTTNLLAIKAFGDDEDECQSSDHERIEELPSEIMKSNTKRKSSLTLKRVKKRKKNISTVADNTLEEMDSDVSAENYACNGSLPEKETRAKTKKLTKKVVPKNDARDDLSLDHHQQNSSSLAITNKVPSRSARRKKAKRLWLREQARIQLENSKIDTEVINQNRISLKNMCGTSSDKVKIGDKNMEAEVVPVVIRPGHIRFEPLDDSDSDKRKPMMQETIRWNGTISKKKGQKWGKETTFVCEKIQEDEDSDDFSLSKVHDDDELSADENQQTCSNTHNFENLCPLTSSPKVGDILAYRLIELSSSWTPELSSFRVGKVSSYDQTSNHIILVPLPEYPIKHSDADAANSTSLYKEDGSLETDYASLVDVRYVEEKTCTESVCKTGGVDEKNSEEQILNNSINAKVSRESNPWEELSKALDDKKAQLLQQEASGTKRSWSYRGLRGSALGPTIARLRAQNDL